MTGSRLYDAYRVLSGTRHVLGQTCQAVQRDLKLHAESSSLVRAVYESSPVFRLVFGNNYRANPRPHPHSLVVKKAPRPAGQQQGPTIAGTIFDAGHRPTVAPTAPADVAGKREYSTQPELIGAAAKKEVL
jgi:hypothetical protein